ncbi:type IV toxin-antitoxin system AbiEi family antitoxin domain-containing protein [Mycoplasma sp. 3341]|uniref:type IV toxin-antitoxin system AbiEi family antitoxin domain-containing protein n=1 Tax=Mycoplasma sp. 3341 TaxID=3447506 RepID=UPI003F65708B
MKTRLTKKLDFYKTASKSNNIIFSHSSAVNLLKNEDPVRVFEITVPQGYNVIHITKKYKNVKVHYVKKEIFDFGIIEKEISDNVKIKFYNWERTFCDLVKAKFKNGSTFFTSIIEDYFMSTKFDSNLLHKTAKFLKIESTLSELTRLWIY